MGKSAKTPKAPDLVAANAAQVAANKGAATDVMNANRYGQVDAAGSSNQWITDPVTGQVTNKTTFGGQPQAYYDALMGTGTNAAQSFANKYYGGGGGGGGGGGSASSGMSINIPNQQAGKIPGNIQKNLDYSNLTAMPTTDPAVARQEAQDALYKMNTQYLDPQMASAQSALQTRLSNQGLVPGTEAYNRAAQIQNDASQKAYESARQGAIAGGGAEAERAQQMALALRNQGVTEAGNLGAFHNAAQAQGAGQYLTDLGQQRQLSGQLGAAGIQAGASMSNNAADNAIRQRQQEYAEATGFGNNARAMLPQFTTSQGVMGNYGAGNLVDAQQRQYDDAVKAAQAKSQGGLTGMLPAIGGLAGTFFGPLGTMAGSALGSYLGGLGKGGGGGLPGMTSAGGYGDMF